MRALTVRQPWAWAIIHGGKDVENRTRNIAGSYRGPVAIHAGLADADNAPDELWLDAMRDTSTTVLRESGQSLARWQPRGVIVGVVDLSGVHTSRESRTASFAGQPVCFKDGIPIGQQCSTWAMTGFEHLEIDNPRPLAEPIPAKGKLGLWTPDAALLAQIREQVPS